MGNQSQGWTNEALAEALRAHFGFSRFQGAQEEILHDVLAGRPTLAVMPTGAGKSLCYQLPAMLLPGTTLVVSPLISLMKDQVDALRARGIGAESLHSGQTLEQQRSALDAVRSGQARLLYVAPERFGNARFLSMLESLDVSLFAVDEAHCISQWGHDFRPDYGRLGEVLGRLRPPRLLACTATATPVVRDDIAASLGLVEPAVHVSGFLRENLHLSVRWTRSDADRMAEIRELAGSVDDGAVIVYANTRKKVETLWRELRASLRQPVSRYHGGLDAEVRESEQQRFADGISRIVVATNAFGMGVDRRDVRLVVHAELPGTVESWYQEVGRAGRDRAPARGVLLFHPNDVCTHHFLIGQSAPPEDRVRRVWSALQRVGPSDAPTLVEAVRVESDASVDAVLRLLEREGLVERDLDGRIVRVEDGEAIDGFPFAEVDARRSHELQKLEGMRRLVVDRGCRHAFLLGYFGESGRHECPGCDGCDGTGHHSWPTSRPGPANEEDTLTIRKALSGVARLNGRYGTLAIASMLAGVRAKTGRSVDLERLPTWGALAPRTPDACREILDVLQFEGLCELVGERYPMLRLRPLGVAVMRGDVAPSFRLPARGAGKGRSARSANAERNERHERPAPARHERPSAARQERPAPARHERPALAPHEWDDVEASLRAWRARASRSAGLPAYTICSNKALDALAVLRPRNEEEFLRVPGVGPRTWERWGEAILSILQGRVPDER